MELPKFIFQAKENLVEKSWGGDWIPLLKGFKQSGIGESWEFSAHPSNPSEVLVKGKIVSMIELVSAARKEVLGKLAEKYTNFPILVKLLDVRERISVQVHPSDNDAKTLGESDLGKDEGWLMLGQGIVYVGLKEDLTKLEPSEELIEKLNRFEAVKFETFKIPAGTIHFAENARILEVSTNSNLTYRIYDFGGREVQLDKAKKVANTRKSEISEIKGERGKLEMEKFAVEVIEVSGTVSLSTNAVFNILFSVDGYTILRSEGEIADLHKGYSCLIPATTQEYEVESDRSILVKIYAK